MVDIETKRLAAKRPTNITLSSDVCDDAKRLGINLSRACDRLLRDEIRQEESKCRRATESAEFIETYNRASEAEGLPLAQWRSF